MTIKITGPASQEDIIVLQNLDKMFDAAIGALHPSKNQVINFAVALIAERVKDLPLDAQEMVIISLAEAIKESIAMYKEPLQ